MNNEEEYVKRGVLLPYYFDSAVFTSGIFCIQCYKNNVT